MDKKNILDEKALEAVTGGRVAGGREDDAYVVFFDEFYEFNCDHCAIWGKSCPYGRDGRLFPGFSDLHPTFDALNGNGKQECPYLVK